jgi:hypothetical protein
MHASGRKGHAAHLAYDRSGTTAPWIQKPDEELQFYLKSTAETPFSSLSIS